MNLSYPQTFEGWSYVNVTMSEAVVLISRLVEKGAGFACTSEVADRRIYFASETSTAIVEEFIRDVSAQRAAPTGERPDGPRP